MKNYKILSGNIIYDHRSIQIWNFQKQIKAFHKNFSNNKY